MMLAAVMNGRGNGNKDEVVFLKQKTQILLREIPPVPVDATWDEFHWRERRRWETDGQYDRIDKRY